MLKSTKKLLQYLLFFEHIKKMDKILTNTNLWMAFVIIIKSGDIYVSHIR